MILAGQSTCRKGLAPLELGCRRQPLTGTCGALSLTGQASLFAIWILVILTVLTVTIGHRVALSLRLARYQQDRFKALILAKSGVNRAIFEIINDKTAGYDSLGDNWANNEEVFKKIIPAENANEFAVVSHGDIFGVIDEERKININTATKELLTALLEDVEGYSAELIKYIRIWRGDNDPLLGAESQDYQAFKKAPFTNCRELVLVLEYFYQNSASQNYRDTAQEAYKKIKDLITVYAFTPDLKININTVSKEALVAVCKAIATEEQKNSAASLTDKIIVFRDEKKYFTAIGDIQILDLTPEEGALLNNLQGNFIFKSEIFFIEALGNVGRIKSRVAAIYNRKDKKILYCNEG